MRRNRKVVYVYKNTTNPDKHSIIFSPRKINLKYHQYQGRMDDPMFRINDLIEPFPEPVKRKVFKKRFKSVNKKQSNRKFYKHQ